MDAQNAAGTVRLLVYSGRPDPEWPLSQDDAARLGESFRQAARTDGGAAPQPRLGYRGFLVRTRAKGLPAEFTVGRGVIVEGAGLRAPVRRDTAGLEEYLLRTARERGHGELLDALGAPGGGEPDSAPA